MEIPRGTKPDYATFAGLALALAGILGGLVIEKGQIGDLSQITAMLIVLGGTTGAVLISTPGASLMRSLRRSRLVFFEMPDDDGTLLERILHFAVLARHGGIVSIEAQVKKIEERFLREALMLAVDGVDTKEIRRILELELQQEEGRAAADAHVFELAGGYAPTIGIIGAVLGLIQVMKHLENIGEVGRGIAVAFVATVYGVGSANLLLLPAAAKIRSRSDRQMQRCELIMEGVLAIAEGLNPHLIRMKLENYMDEKSVTWARTAGKPTTAARAATAGSGA
jgi:chemotaxis protein MotA